jgi:hypothetical protein
MVGKHKTNKRKILMVGKHKTKKRKILMLGKHKPKKEKKNSHGVGSTNKKKPKNFQPLSERLKPFTTNKVGSTNFSLDLKRQVPHGNAIFWELES